MKQEKSSTASGGIGFSSLLLLAFIILKLTHVIDWSWWWVLAPLWIPIGIYLILLVVLGIVKIIVKRKRSKRTWMR